MTVFLLLLALLVPCAGAAFIVWAGRVLVPPEHVGLVKRNRFGRTDPRFQRINPFDGRGLQARTLPPNTPRWLTPGLYSVEAVPKVHVPPGMIGIVTAQDGARKPSGRPGRHVDCDDYQDGQAFLLNGGERGVQATTLAGDSWYFINTRLFEVRTVPRTHVPPGTIGLVRAKVGRSLPPDRAFGRHVDCDCFQNGQAFLDGGGEQGKQLAILQSGYYDINPELFEVITVDNVAGAPDGLTADHLKEISIPVGYIGVVVVLEGAEPPRGGSGMVAPIVEGHRSFRLPWVFLDKGGYRGVQQEILAEGTVCALNPWFVRVVLIPTRVLIMEWSDKTPSKATNYDAELEQITVTVQGYRLRVDMDQTLRIPEEAAPRLVSEFGGSGTSGLGGLVDDPLPVQRFVEKVLGNIVVGYFAGIAAGATVDGFLRTYAETRTNLTAQVRAALKSKGVEAIRTNLGSFTAEDPELNRRLQREADEQMDGRALAAERENLAHKEAIDEFHAKAERRRAAMELKGEIDALGQDNVAMIRMIEQISKMQVPDYIGGGDVSAYADALPMPILRDLITRLRELRTDRQLPPAPEPEEEDDDEN